MEFECYCNITKHGIFRRRGTFIKNTVQSRSIQALNAQQQFVCSCTDLQTAKSKGRAEKRWSTGCNRSPGAYTDICKSFIFAASCLKANARCRCCRFSSSA